MFKISLIEGIKNIDKNKTMTYLTVFLFAFLFLLQGYTYSYYSVSQMRNKVIDNETFANYEIYSFSIAKGMAFWDVYLETNYGDILIDETMEFVETMNNIEYLDFIFEDFDEIYVYDFKGDLKDFGVEETPETWDQRISIVFGLFVSPNFHKVESYRVIEGRDFTDDDMVYVKGSPRSILLGYKYKDIYDVGDIIKIPDNTLYYDDFVSELKVIGFLEEDTAFIDRSGFQIFDMDNYMILPSIHMSRNEYYQLNEEFRNKRSSRFIVQNTDYLTNLFQTKMFIHPEHESEVLLEIQEAVNNYCGVSQCVTLSNNGQASLKRASRTEALTEFFAMITAVAMTFAVATVLISITNRVSRNMKDYAIHITVGATRGNAVMFIVAEMALILTCSIILGLIATKWMMYYINMPFFFWRFLGVYALTSVVVLALSAIVARIAMRKYDICNLIK